MTEQVEMLDEIEDYLAQGQKINAIKYYRDEMKVRFDEQVSLRESKDFVEFECTSSLDLQNRNAPKRIITRKDFPSVGTFA